jgi:hypothetical protein
LQLIGVILILDDIFIIGKDIDSYLCLLTKYSSIANSAKVTYKTWSRLPLENIPAGISEILLWLRSRFLRFLVRVSHVPFSDKISLCALKREKKKTVNLNSYKRTLTSRKWDWAILTNLSTKDLLRGLGQGYPSTRCDSISFFYKHEKNINNKQIQKKNT